MIWSKQISGTKKMGHTTQTSATKTWIQNSILTESWQRCQTGDVNISTNRSPHVRRVITDFRCQEHTENVEQFQMLSHTIGGFGFLTRPLFVSSTDPVFVVFILTEEILLTLGVSIKMAAVNVFQLEISWRCLTIWTLRAFTFNIVKEDTKRKHFKVRK